MCSVPANRAREILGDSPSLGWERVGPPRGLGPGDPDPIDRLAMCRLGQSSRPTLINGQGAARFGSEPKPIH